MDAVNNFAKAIVDGVYESTDTAIDIRLVDLDRFTVPPFNVVWWNITDYPDPSDDPAREIVRVTDIDGNTFTITRAQEGTFAADHNEAGKTYALAQTITARTIKEMVGNVVSFTNPYIRVDLDNDNIEVTSDLVMLGDVQGAGNSTTIAIDDNATRIGLTGQLGTDQIASASGPVGTVVGKIPILDAAGDLAGYIPIYNSIT